jgi:hypothetical protein
MVDRLFAEIKRIETKLTWWEGGSLGFSWI